MSRFAAIFPCHCPVIGMLHAPALPGAPRYAGDWNAIRRRVLLDAEGLAAGGCAGLMLENYGDVPFFPGQVPAATVAALTSLAADVKSAVKLPLGINVLRNDGRSALAIAATVGCQFIRVNVLCGARLTDQGIIAGIAHDLLRDRAALRAEHVAILADVDVKHSAPLSLRPMADEAQDLVHRGLADGLIVSGNATGAAPEPRHLQLVRQAVPGMPVLVGSGATAQNVAAFLPSDGFIVGTAFKQQGDVNYSVDRQRVAAFQQAWAAAVGRDPEPAG